MIRTEREYELARRHIMENKRQAEEYRAALEREGLDAQAVERLMAPALGFHREVAEEVEAYERARSRDFGPVPFVRLGRLLIGLRIANGLSQRQLADRLGVHESMVSRDERNEYHGITVERAQRILDALGEEVEVSVVTAQPVSTPSRTA